MDEKNLREIIKTAADEMIGKYTRLKEIAVPGINRVNAAVNAPGTTRQAFEQYAENIVYIFFTQTLPGGYKTPGDAKRNFDVFNGKSRGNCMSRVNEAHWQPETGGTVCLYVGSCKNNARERMKHHLEKITENKTNVYGLHLEEWLPGGTGFWIDVLDFGDSIDEDYLQIIEDALWKAYKPLFGRMGHK
jgi:hypothetical protein